MMVSPVNHSLRAPSPLTISDDEDDLPTVHELLSNTRAPVVPATAAEIRNWQRWVFSNVRMASEDQTLYVHGENITAMAKHTLKLLECVYFRERFPRSVTPFPSSPDIRTSRQRDVTIQSFVQEQVWRTYKV